MKRLLCLVLGLTLLPTVCDAGDIRFQRYGNQTRFRGDGFSGNIYNDGFGGGRIKFDNNYRTYQQQPQILVPFNIQPQYGTNAPLYVPLQRATNAPSWWLR